MVPKYLFQLIAGGENEKLDFKKTITSVSKIAKTMVSFANHKGGKLLVGVNDNQTISGVRCEEDKYMLDMAAEFYCKPSIKIETEIWEFDGKTILEVTIPTTNQKPYYAKDEEGKWWVYIRVKDQCLLASKVMMDVLKRDANKTATYINFSSKEKGILEYLTTHDKITTKEICKMLNISRWRAQKILVNLVSIGAIRIHTHEKTEYFTI